MSSKLFKMLHNTEKNPQFLFKCFKKASHHFYHFYKASISLKMYFKSLAIFENPSQKESKFIKKTSSHLKFSENIIEMLCILQRSLAFSKRASWQLPLCHNFQSAPGQYFTLISHFSSKTLT
jgi:hypothetical protein